ncbi:MAG: DUF421 domain-containing protein [Clostridiales bacterium]|nr:DUF421 domain-containing protein [Clostridiales bacterium]
MLVIFIRAVLLYVFILFILRMTGKRQISDLEPFDLLITLTIADIASTAIPDVDTPLLYSVIPIIALYLVQQVIIRLSLKSRKARAILCGSPLILIRDGVMQENMMRQCGYTVADLSDHLRTHDVFDVTEVAYAILESNGGMTVLLKTEKQSLTREDLNLPKETVGLSHMLVADGKLCEHSLVLLGVDANYVKNRLQDMKIDSEKDVFFLQRAADGTLTAQLREKLGSECITLPAAGGAA